MKKQLIVEIIKKAVKEAMKKRLKKEGVSSKIECQNCSWSWEKKDGGKDPRNCHKCGHTNTLQALEGVNSPDFLKLNTIIIVSSKVKIQSKFDLIYSVLRDSWGFDANNNGGHISSHLTFFAYFFYAFMLCCIINLEESDSIKII